MVPACVGRTFHHHIHQSDVPEGHILLATSAPQLRNVHTQDGKSRYHPDTKNPEAKTPESMAMLTEIYPTPLVPREHRTTVSCSQRPGLSQLITDNSSYERYTGNWRSLHSDTSRMTSCRDVVAPLSLHIPKPMGDLPNSDTHTTPPDSRFPDHIPTRSSTLLPSIAHLHEHARYRYGAGKDRGASSIAAQPECSCTAIKPLLDNVVDSVLQLTERLYDSRSGIINHPRPECTDSDPVRSLQWILDQLRRAKCELDEILALQKAGDTFRDPRSTQSLPSPGGSKRGGDTWDDGDGSHKRARLRASSFETQDLNSGFGRLDHARREQPRTFSPTPTDSLLGSACPPRNMSPSNHSHRAMRALPSPSPITHTSSAGSALPPLAAHSIGSPATSYHAASSANTISADSVTSAHIADLQHQVTLKSLALQTLQSEYASLLQKLQREKVKSQTIERKTTAADEEMNELTSKNEDLAEQLKQVASQLEDSEKKREAARLEAQREKDQWSRMLEMSGRLQAKVDAERQRLREEKEQLLSRIARHEQDRMVESRLGQTTKGNEESQLTSPHTAISKISARASDITPVGETTALRQHIALLNSRMEALKTALGHVRTQSASLGEKAHVLQQQSSALSNLAEAALKSDATGAG